MSGIFVFLACATKYPTQLLKIAMEANSVAYHQHVLPVDVATSLFNRQALLFVHFLGPILFGQFCFIIFAAGTVFPSKSGEYNDLDLLQKKIQGWFKKGGGFRQSIWILAFTFSGMLAAILAIVLDKNKSVCSQP